jgi:hypothetical protein
MAPTTTYLVMLAVTSAVWYVFVTRTGKSRGRRPNGSSSGSGGSPDSGFSGWFGHHTATDSSGHPIDGGGWHSGSHSSGGDSGSGDGGGGDGGGDGGGGGD